MVAAGRGARAGPRRAAASRTARTGPSRSRARPDAAAAGQPRLRAALLVLLDPHVLPHRPRQGGARAQAGQSRRGDAAPRRRPGVRVFLFQDDDFPLWGRGRRWARRARRELHASGLPRRDIWKISCRAEYVEPELFADDARRRALPGLHGPRVRHGRRPGGLHKQITVEQNIRAVESLKQLGIAVRLRLHAVRPVEHLRVGPRRTSASCGRSSATAPAARRVLPDASLRRHANPRAARAGRPAARRRLTIPTTTSSTPGWTTAISPSSRS